MEEEKLHISYRESSRVIFLQVLPSYLLAGLGMVMAGMLLDQVQVSDSWTSPLCDTSTVAQVHGYLKQKSNSKQSMDILEWILLLL